MKRAIRLGLIVLFVAAAVAAAGARLQAWNPAAHIYIAQNVYPAHMNSRDLWYGAIAPDMAMYVPADGSWESAFWDTHWTVTDLRLWAWTAAQRVFGRGWVTHNEMYAADHYAHGYPPLYLAGYITLRANLLAVGAHISPDLAHYAIETAVDLRLKTARPYLAGNLMTAATAPPSYVQSLLTRVFVWWPFQRTDVQTLAATQAYFNQVVSAYALALAQSTVADYDPIVEIGVELAKQMGMPGSDVELEGQVRSLLAAALALTADYDAALNLTIRAVSQSVPR